MKKVLNIAGIVLCSITCLILFLLQIGFLSILPAKSLITKESVKGVINNVNIRELISESPKDASDIYGAFDSLGFSVEETNEILDSYSFKEFLNNNIYGNINNILDKKDINMDFNELKTLMDNIEKEKGITFENKENFLKFAEDKYSSMKNEIDISNDINQSITPDLFEIIKFLASGVVFIIFAILFIVEYLKMCLFRWSFYKPLIWYGITTIISSFIMLQVFLGSSIMNSINDGKIEKIMPIILPALKTFKNKGIIISLTMLLIGILMVVAFYFINKKIKSNDLDNIEKKLETL